MLLLEAQTTVAGTTGFLPVEVESAVFDAIRAATARGIVVVEAGGNGSNDLDTFRNAAGKLVLNRNSADFRDSGAIMVGAASSTVPHRRLDFSNFGSRIDCYGWGQNVATTGDGWMGNQPTLYTDTFSGTSSASPIVAGAAILVQSTARALPGGQPYSPAALREILRNPQTGTPSDNPATDRIGVMPNLAAILRRTNPFELANDRWRQIIAILFGVIDDAGGIVFGPNGPRPVGPWHPGTWQLAPEKRDVLLGLAMTEIAALADNTAVRAEIERAAFGVLRASVERLAPR